MNRCYQLIKTIRRFVFLTAATAMLAVPAAAQAASPNWRILGVTGPTHLPPAFASEKQTVTLPPTGATFTLTFGGDTTSPINRGAASGGDVEAALNLLPSINAGGGSVSVSARFDPANGAITGYDVTFDGGPLAGTDVPLMTASGASVAPTESGKLAVYATNVGGVDTGGTSTVTIGPLPAGITAGSAAGTGWSCTDTPPTVTCTRTGTVAPMRTAPPVGLPLFVAPAAAETSSIPVSISGGGAAPDPVYHTHHVPVRVTDTPVQAGVQAFWAGAFDEDGEPVTQAGAHPHSAGTMFIVNTSRRPNGQVLAAGDVRDVIVDLPPGFVGNPMVTPRCPRNQPTVPGGNLVGPGPGGVIGNPDCTYASHVGEAGPMTDPFVPSGVGSVSPVFNAVPPPGYAASFGFPIIVAQQVAVGSVRSTSDYGVTVTAPDIQTVYKVTGSSFMVAGAPSTAGGDAFLSNPTDCSGSELPTTVHASAWHQSDVFSSLSDVSPATTGCDQVPFAPTASVAPSSTEADGAGGLDFDLSLPQDGLLDPDELATSHLKDVRVELPDGVSVNPSAATGLQGCSDAEMDAGSDDPPSCPDGSRIGRVEVTSPLVDHVLDGVLYLGSPKSTDPTSGEMLRLWVVVRDDELGIMLKLPGSSTAEPQTGKLVATFENNPRLPFSDLDVELKGGDHGVLAMPATCSTRESVSAFTPWSRAHLPAGDGPGTQDPVDIAEDWTVDQDCGHGFAPGLDAGVSDPAARKSGTFSFELTRPQGDQTLQGLTAELPQGLLASVKEVPLCTNAQADAGNCPAASRIGTVDASAGSGDPFVLEQKGETFLTEGYKGGPYGLMVKVRAIAGPFRGAMELSPIVVRQKIDVDPTTAQVTAVSDPFPTVWHGVPLRVRRVLVNVDRFGFMLNPSDCAGKQVKATLTSTEDTTHVTADHFQARGCAALPFKPDLALALTGRKQVTTGRHPGVKAKVTQAGTSEAGIEQAVVRLPKSLALDPNNAQALCEFADGTKPDLENHCPKGSIVGRARAKTPLLRNDLTGNVYFVKNVRRDPVTGNEIRTLPMLIIALRGEIAINLRGESSTTKTGRLVNTFANVPDAPISQFNLNVAGGANGILAVTRTRKAKINLCAGRHIAESEMDGHNGRRHDADVRMKTPCTKKQTKAAKLRAKRAAAKARAGSKRR